MERKQYPSELAEKFMLRLDAGMRDKLKVLAALNRRSMNAEINVRLMNSMSDSDVRRLNEVCS